MSVSLAQTAEALASAGYHVFPLEVRGKRPLTALARHGKDDATNNVETVRGWWQAVPNANIGIATAPSGIVVLDVDVAGQKQGMASLQALQIEHGLPRTLTARTGRGGIHYVYARPAGEAPHTRLSFRPGLDLIGNGYIVAAPSVLEDGGQYTWSAADPIVVLPAPLVEVMRGRGPSTSTSTPAATVLGAGTAGLDPRDAQAAVLELAASWPTSGRHEAQLALAGALAQEGWQPEEIAAFAAAVARLEPGREPGYDGEPAKRLAAARASVVKVEAGEEVAGWGKLVQRLGARGQDVVDGVRRRLRVGQGTVDTMQSIVQAGGGSLTPAGAAAQAPWEAGAAQAQAPGARDLDSFVFTADQVLDMKQKPTAVTPTGFEELDERLGGGLFAEQVVGIAAPPGSYKTAFALDLLDRLSEHGDTLYLGGEIPLSQAVARLGAMILDEEIDDPDAANAPAWRDAVAGRAIAAEVHRAARSSRVCMTDASYLQTLRRGSSPPATMRQAAVAVIKGFVASRKEKNPDARVYIVVDYVGKFVDPSDDVRTATSAFVGDLWEIANEPGSNVVILAIFAVSREMYGNGKPQMIRKARDATAYLAAGKESGAIEFDVVTFLYLDVDRTVRTPDGCVTGVLNVAKTRMGEACQVGFKIRPASGRWIPDPDAVDRIVDADAERKDTKKSMREIAKVGKREAEAASAAVVAHEGPPKPNTPKHDPAQVARDVQLRRDVLDLLARWDERGSFQGGYSERELRDAFDAGYDRAKRVLTSLVNEGSVACHRVRRVDDHGRRQKPTTVYRLASIAPVESPAPVIAPGGEMFARFAGVDKVREETGPPLTATPVEADQVVRGYVGL